jgi:hypothetical protein
MSFVTTVAMARRSFAVKGFWALWDNVYECVTIDAMARRSFAVKGFWALWDNAYECECCNGTKIICCQGILGLVG